MCVRVSASVQGLCMQTVGGHGQAWRCGLVVCGGAGLGGRRPALTQNKFHNKNTFIFASRNFSFREGENSVTLNYLPTVTVTRYLS